MNPYPGRSERIRMDIRGIVTFLVQTYGLTAGAVVLFMLFGTATPARVGTGGLLLFFLLMQIPGIAARYVGRGNLDYPPPRWSFLRVPKGTALAWTVLIPALFLAVYVVTTMAGWAQPDWRLGRLWVSLPPRRFLPFTHDVRTAILLAGGFTFPILLGHRARPRSRSWSEAR